MSQKELKRVLVLQKVLDKDLTVKDAALVLGLSERQVYRLKARFRSQGPASLAHGNRGRKPVHSIPDDVQQQVVSLAQTKYRGCNYTFLSELLCEHDGICLSPSSVRRILKRANVPSSRKHRPPKQHRSRPRKPQMGMLVQIDGSHHDWLEGRGPQLVLLSAVDDATSRVLSAVFWPAENFEGYCYLLRDLVTHYGIPLAIYSDRHSLFFSPRESNDSSFEHQLLGQTRPLTQIGRILNELGIEHIPACSPQAKGRIERSFLTFQERLLVELRLADARTVDEANAVLQRFIVRYNQKFAVPPADSVSAFRPIPSHLRLDHIFCWKEYRTLNPGYTIQYKGQTYRVVNAIGAPSIPLRSVVEVHQLIGGGLSAAWGGYIYGLEPIVSASIKDVKVDAMHSVEGSVKDTGSARKPYKPRPDHPWRKSWVSHRVYSATEKVKVMAPGGQR